MSYDDLGIDIPAAMLAERQRQLVVEGWSTEHDTQHDAGGLLTVAMFYYRHGAGLSLPLQLEPGTVGRAMPVGWPWAPQWWKPKTPSRDLERAGALCLAEIDRLRALEPDCDVSVVTLVLNDIVKAYGALAEAA